MTQFIETTYFDDLELCDEIINFFNQNNNLFNINFYQSDGNTEYDSFGSNLNQDHKDSHIKLAWNRKYEGSESNIVFIQKQNKINQNASGATD